MVQRQLGTYYQRRLEIGIVMIADDMEMQLDLVQAKEIEFPELGMNWPVINQVKTIDDAKTLFRLANTQFKRAMEFYVLDGFVTENADEEISFA